MPRSQSAAHQPRRSEAGKTADTQSIEACSYRPISPQWWAKEQQDAAGRSEAPAQAP